MRTLKPILLTLLLLPLAPWCKGQSPDWVDESKRNRAYPSELYLRGFVAESKVQENEKVMNRLKDLAKSDLIESIQVSIQSKSELREQEQKSSFQQSFLFESSSFSEADIYGLETQAYYDKKQKRAFAFAFVKKEKLIEYFKSVINLGFSNNDLHFKSALSNTGSKNLGDALIDVFAIDDELKSIYKAESVLQAIGVGDNSILKKDRYVQDKNKRNEILSAILSKDEFSTKNAVSYFVNTINRSIIDKKKAKIFINTFKFRDYSLSSGLTASLSQIFSTEFSKMDNLSLVQDSTNCDAVVKGSYDDTPEKVNITISVKNKATGIHKISTPVSVKSLKEDKIEYLPIEIQRARALGSVTLISDLKKVSVKCNQPVNIPYKIKTSYSAAQKDILQALPISFSMNNRKKPLSVVSTNESGEAKYVIVSVKSPAKSQRMVVSVDLAGLLNIDTLSQDFIKIKKEATIPSLVLNIDVTGNVLYCSSKERNLGNDLTSPFLKEGVKDVLSRAGFEFTTEIARADYILKIESNTRQGSSIDDLFFSYLDASLTLEDQGQKKEVLTSQYADIKGAGTNYEGAGIKAYSAAVKKIEKDLVDYFAK